MSKKIHTILALAAAAVLWTGCDDGVELADTHRTAISFACDTEKTRVQETTVVNLMSFRVSAVLNRTAMGWGYNDKFMDGQAVEKDANENWIYSPVCYMPTDGSTVDFFAYAPANAAVSGFSVDGDNHDQVSFSYDVTTDAGAQYDFMVADALGKTASPILLEFKHVLASVKVEAKNSSPYTLRVREVKLLNICRKGVLRSHTSDAGSRTTSWAWDELTDPSTYTVAQDGVVVLEVSDAYVPVSDDVAGPLMILPQTVERGGAVINPDDIGTAAYVVATFDVFDGSDPVERNAVSYIPITNPDVPGDRLTFEIGQKYVLRIELEYQ